MGLNPQPIELKRLLTLTWFQETLCCHQSAYVEVKKYRGSIVPSPVGVCLQRMNAVGNGPQHLTQLGRIHCANLFEN